MSSTWHPLFSGYQIQPHTLETILKRYSRVVPPNGRCIIAFDDFVAVSVRLRAYTGWFKNCLEKNVYYKFNH